MYMYEAVCSDDGSPRGFISEASPEFKHAREALRDIRQLEFFFEQIAADTNKDTYADIVERILKDSMFPQDDAENSSGRDAQAEAFAFAVCMNAGMNPAFEEPDVTCEIDGQRFGVAVKRIKTLRQLKRRLKEAAGQIHKSGLPGIISMDATLAVNPENHSIVTNQDENEVRNWWTREMKKRVDEINKETHPGRSSEGVLGVFLHEHCPVCFKGDYTLRSMTYGIETADSTTKAVWLKFKNRFIKGLPRLV